MTRRIRYMSVLAVMAGIILAATGTARAQVLFSSNFNNLTGGNQNATQGLTGYLSSFGGSYAATSWTDTGSGAINATEINGDWLPGMFEGPNINVLTSTSITGANTSGQTYRVTFEIAPDTYAGTSQGTINADGDGIVATVLNTTTSATVTTGTYLPGTFTSVANTGFLPFQSVTLNYTGTGSTAATISFNATNSGQNRFGGVMDYVVVQETVLWNGATSGNWSSGTNWSLGAAPVNGNVVLIGGASGGSINNDLSSLQTGGIEFESGAGPFTVAGNSVTLAGNLNNLSASTQTVNLNMALSGAYCQSNVTSGNLIVGGIISDGGGGLPFTKIGAGTLTLSNANTYSGVTSIYGGVLSVSTLALGGAASGIGESSNAAANLILNGGTLQYTGNGATTDRLFTIEPSGGTLDASGTGPLVWSNTGAIVAVAGNGYTYALNLTGTNTGANTLTPTLAGASTLTKSGSGTWVLAGANTYSGATAITAGTLQIGAGGTAGSLGTNTGAITNNGALAYDLSSTVTLANAITGTGSFTQLGGGTTRLSGASSYSGATSITAGTLALTSTASLGNTAIGVSSLANFTPQPGTGTITAGTTSVVGAGASLNLAANSVFNMTDSAIGTFKLQQQSGFAAPALTLASAALDFNFSNTAADLLAAGGAASVSGTNTINLTLVGSSLPPTGLFNLITASSGLTGTFQFANNSTTESMVVGGNTYSLTLGNSATAETLTIGSGTPVVTWTGQVGGTGAAASTWDIGTTNNWANSSNSEATYADGDAVDFTDTNPVTSSQVTNGTINIQSAGVSPTAVIFNNSSVNYTISAASGPIQGATTTVAKSGSALLTINNLNTYAGGTTVAGGTLRVGVGTTVASGAVTGGPVGTGTLTLSGGTLQDNGMPITLANNIAITASSTLSSSGSGSLVFDGTSLSTPATVALSGSPMLTVSNTTTINDVITGSGQSLTVAGTGTLILGGANTYSGTTTISSGTLRLGNGTTNGSLAGGVTNNSALVFATTGTQSFGSAISGSGSVAMNGSGTLTLTAANSYSGGTNVNSGTLAFGIANALPTAGAVTITGSTLSLGTFSGTVGAVNLISGTISGTTGTLTGTSYSTQSGTISAILAGAGSLTQTAGGTTSLTGANTYTGNTTINGGILAVTGTGQLYSGGNDSTSVTTVNSGGTLEVDRWDGGQDAPYYPSPDPTLFGTGSFGDLFYNNNLIVINGGTIMYTGNSNFHGANLDGRGFTIGAGGATLDAATAGQTWYIDLDNRNGAYGIASNGGTLTLTGAGNGAVDKIIPGTGGVTVSGPGTWTLTAANSYSGVTSVGGGVLSVNTMAVEGSGGGAASAIGESSNAAGNLVLNGGTLQYTGPSTTTDRLFTLGSNGGTLDASGTGPVVWSNTSALAGNGYALTLIGTNTGANTLTPVLAGASSLTKSGSGTWVLAGSNTYSGNTSVNAGTLALAGTASLGNTAIGVSSGATFAPQPGSGTIIAGSTSVVGAGASLNLAAGAVFSMIDGAIGTFQLQQESTFPGPALTIAGATLNFDANNLGSDLLAAGGAASVSGVNTVNVNLLNFSVPPSGVFNLITASSGLTGTFQFSNDSTSESAAVNGNTYSLTLGNSPSAETLTIIQTVPVVTWTGQVGGSGSAASTWDIGTTTNWANASNAAVTYADGDDVAFTDTNPVSSSPVTNGTINIQSGGVSPAGVFFSNSSVNYTISATSGPIQGAAALSKSGSALLTINNLNTYTGGTTVSGGTLRVGASTTVSSGAITGGPLGTGTLTLSGGALQDNGTAITLANNVAISANTTLSSSGGGTLTFDGTSLTTPATVALSNNPTLTVNNTTTINNVITGSSQNLTVAGSGTLVLGGNNTYSGTTTISSGTLQLGNGTTDGSVVGNITNNSALVFTTAATPSYSGVISGSGSVRVNGSGTLTLSGANSFTGGLTVASGTLSVATWNNQSTNGPLGFTTSDITLGSATSGGGMGTVIYTGSQQANDNSSVGFNIAPGGGTIDIAATGAGSAGSGPYLEIGSSPGGATTGGITGSGPLTVTTTLGDRLITVGGSNSFTGPVTISPNSEFQTIAALTGTETPFGAGTNGQGSTITMGANSILDVYFAQGFSTVIPIGSLNSTASTGTVRIETVGTLTLNLGGDGTSASYAGTIIPNSGTLSIAMQGPGSQTFSGANTYNGGTTISGGTLRVANPSGTSGTGTGSVTVNGGTLAGSLSPSQGFITGAVTVNSGGTISATNGATLTLSGGLTLASGAISTFNLAGGANANPLIATSGGAGGNSLVVTGTDAISLASAPAIGTYQLFSFSDVAAPSASNFTLPAAPSGQTYTINVASSQVDLIVAASLLTWTDNSGSHNWDTTTTNNWAAGSSNATYTDDIAVAFNDTNATSGTPPSGTVVVQVGGVAPLSVTFGNSAVSYVLSNSGGDTKGITGSAPVAIQGGGTVRFNSPNTYTGTTTISNGTLILGDPNAVQNSTVSVGAAGALQFAAALGGANLGGLAGSGDIALQDNAVSPAAIALTVGGNNASTAYSGSLGGPGGLTKVGSGTLLLSGASSYGGNTTISAGTLQLGVNNALPAATSLSVASQLDLNGYNQTVAGLSGSGTIASSAGAPQNPATLTYSGAASTFGGTIADSFGSGSGTVALQVSGGTLALSGSNTYSGGTTVSAGTLRVANAFGSSATGGGPVAVAAGGTLSGGGGSSFPGFIGGAVTVASGAIISPSGGGVLGATSNVGTLTVGSLTLNSTGGASLNYQINNSSSLDAIAVTDTLTLPTSATSGATQFNFYVPGMTTAFNGFTVNVPYQLMSYAGSATVAANTLTVNPSDVPAGDTYSFIASGGVLDLTFMVSGASANWSASNDSNTNWTNTANWTPVVNPTIPAYPNGPGQVATFGTSSVAAVTLGSNFVVGQLVFNGVGTKDTILGGSDGSLTLNNSGAGPNITVSASADSMHPLLPEINVPLILADGNGSTTTFNVGSGSYLTVFGAISEMTYTNQGIQLTGGGSLELDGANTYSGGTTVSGGMLVVNTSAAGATTLGSGPLAINGSSSNVTVTSPALTVGSLSGSSGGQLNVGSSTMLTVNQTTTSTFNGTLLLNGGLVLAGASGNTLTINGQPTLAAGSSITVNSGTLALANNTGTAATVLGTSYPAVSVASGATLQLAGSSNVLSSAVNITTQGSGLTTDGAVSVVGASTQTVGVISGQAVNSSPTTYSGNTTVGDGTNAANLTATQILQNTLTIAAGSTVTIAPSGSGISMDAVVANASRVTSDAANSTAAADGDSSSDPFTAIQAAIASGSISSAKGQQLENRIAAIERLAANDPGLDVSLLEDRVLAALPTGSVWSSSGTSPLVETGSGLLAVGSGNLASSSDATSSNAATFAPSVEFGGGPAAVPEPSSLLLVAIGGIGILIAGYRRTSYWGS